MFVKLHPFSESISDGWDRMLFLLCGSDCRIFNFISATSTLRSKNKNKIAESAEFLGMLSEVEAVFFFRNMQAGGPEQEL